MPVVTRSQQKIICTQKFKITIEDPCILKVIVGHLNTDDLIHMSCLSKDHRYKDVLINKLNEIKENKLKTKTFINKVKFYLDTIEKTRGVHEKIALVNQQFEFLCENKWFLEKHKIFYNVVHKKIFELIYTHSKWQSNGVDFLIKLFNVKPPRDYYDSEVGILKYGIFDIHNKFVELYKYPSLEL
jgi:hypothetical protein